MRTNATAPMRIEHQDLIPHIESLRTVANSIGSTSPEEVRRGVDEAYRFLTHHLLPHAEAEDRYLYPFVDMAIGAAGATATMSRDHAEVARLTEELGELLIALGGGSIPPTLQMSLRRVLYGLYALVKVHLAKEEEIYFPLLDENLTPEEAQGLLESMHAARGRGG